MNVALVVFTDGRQRCLEKTLDSLIDQVVGGFGSTTIVNDSPDPDFRDWIDRRCVGWKIVHTSQKLGFCGAVNLGWGLVPEDATHVWHQEDDFEFLCRVELAQMAQVLDNHPKLVQLVLKRQPWSPQEKEWGDLVWTRPDLFTEKEYTGLTWVEHREFFSTNPMMMKTRWIRSGMPVIPECEGKFGFKLRQDPDIRFGFWGDFWDAPKVNHIGDVRVGSGY